MTLETLIAIAPEALIIAIFVTLTLIITWRRRPRNAKLRDMRTIFSAIAILAILLLAASLYFTPPPTDPSEYPTEIPTTGANP